MQSKIEFYDQKQKFNDFYFFSFVFSFRFMLNATGNYIYQLADPDINFDWETIEQVVSFTRKRRVYTY